MGAQDPVVERFLYTMVVLSIVVVASRVGFATFGWTGMEMGMGIDCAGVELE